MTHVPTDLTTQPPGRTRLVGWKEIAAHLGRGVRTAQRWEREFGLPVRRMGASRTESVFAFTEEIDGWLATTSAANAQSDPLVDTGEDEAPTSTADNGGFLAPPSATAVSASEATPGRRRVVSSLLKVAATLGALVAIAAAAWLWFEIGTRSSRFSVSGSAQPASAAVDVDTLVVKDADGLVLWTRKFPVPLRADDYSKAVILPLLGVEDLDGDGARETWIALSPVRTEDAAFSDLWMFNADGSLRWRFAHEGTVRFGETTWGAPWPVHHVFVTNDPHGRSPRALWTASRERTEFPCVLERLDLATGKPLATYWSNGYIDAVVLGTWRGRPALFVGGAFNERVSAGLAVLDALNPSGSAPAERAKYRCTTCPPGEPLAFVVFPKPARFASYGGSGGIYQINVGGGVPFLSAVTLHAVGGNGRAVGVYNLDSTLRPVHVDAADYYQSTYEALVREALIPEFLPAKVDPASEFLPILYWVAGTFVPVGQKAD